MSDRYDCAPLAVSMGDPAGIGPELAVRAWLARADARLPPFALYAIPEVITAAAHRLGAALPIAPVSGPEEAAGTFDRRLPIVPLEAQAPVEPGRPDVANGLAIQSAIRQAALALGRGAAVGIVTLPIAKSVLTAAGFPYPGHTEYLAALAGEIWQGQVWTAVMMLAAPELRVVPATVHIPLSAVPAALSPDRLERTIRITAAALRTDFGLSTPRIAVAGLNPHAGEQGTMGREDDEIIRPVVTALAAEGLAITGPHPADTLFHPAARARYDAVVAMYHDQALIPIKTIAFDHAVNVTLGLPFVRTSPDHGTAFDIAGRNLADPSSFFAALRLADAMAGRRRSAR